MSSGPSGSHTQSNSRLRNSFHGPFILSTSSAHSKKYLFFTSRSSSYSTSHAQPQESWTRDTRDLDRSARKYVRLSDPVPLGHNYNHAMAFASAGAPAADTGPASSSTLVQSSSQPSTGQSTTQSQAQQDPLPSTSRNTIEIRNDTKFSLNFKEHHTVTNDALTGRTHRMKVLRSDDERILAPRSTMTLARQGPDLEEEKFFLTIWSTQQLAELFIRFSEVQTGWLWRKKRKTFVDASLQRDTSYHNLPLTFNVGRDYVVVSLKERTENPFEDFKGRKVVISIAHEKKGR